ncbi:hypothetical protein TTHERM_001414123 (macronuclear) [Tetrahymena thermophila SB210]|uniref:Uncharacterized protein n=1 Tax=Tetrahymena thermophila (strain SB210) TaxID=312017 RepID=W7XI74_TETTS|nr:hypothetical protein TTHERM_001414123 [Tetrahymena thermophila SB210]EWS73064.1 hypothetical protein TTHERM_001414123 [Tetrahymena thermophila SB210]|eukprot:XP_012654402.1 hypothetical protein TTHERM_001414123 [Tetrahymena thermophila SB210]
MINFQIQSQSQNKKYIDQNNQNISQTIKKQQNLLKSKKRQSKKQTLLKNLLKSLTLWYQRQGRKEIYILKIIYFRRSRRGFKKLKRGKTRQKTQKLLYKFLIAQIQLVIILLKLKIIKYEKTNKTNSVQWKNKYQNKKKDINQIAKQKVKHYLFKFLKQFLIQNQ